MKIAASDEVISQLLEQKDSLEARREEIDKQLQRITNMLNVLNGGTAIRYNWTGLALGFITSHGRFIRTTEILDYILSESEDKHNEKKKRQALIALSVALNNMVDKGTLRKIVLKGIKGHFYGLPEWFEKDGSPKKEHIVNLMARYGKVSDVLKMDLSQLTAMQAAIVGS